MPETIGQRLKQAREEKRLTLEKAAEATRVRLPYLQALENDDYSVMISAAQGRGFLRLYADFLGVDLDAVVNEVKAANATAHAPTIAPAPATETTPEPPAPAEPPASSPDPKPARPGFWSRLLRRSAPAAEPQVEPKPEPQPEPVAASEPQVEMAAPLTIEETPPPAVEETAVPATIEEDPVKPAKRARRASASTETEPKKKPRTAAGKKKLLTT